MPSLTTDMREKGARPYFLWNESTTIAEFEQALRRADEDERARLLGKLLREARDEDVWAFTTVAEVRALMPKLDRHLGRRRAFWHYLLDAWQRHGLA